MVLIFISTKHCIIVHCKLAVSCSIPPPHFPFFRELLSILQFYKETEVLISKEKMYYSVMKSCVYLFKNIFWNWKYTQLSMYLLFCSKQGEIYFVFGHSVNDIFLYKFISLSLPLLWLALFCIFLPMYIKICTNFPVSKLAHTIQTTTQLTVL